MLSNVIIVEKILAPSSFLRVPIIFFITTGSLSGLSALLFVGSIRG